MRPREPAGRYAQMRQRIAQLAAQLMAEHGIRDFALAKRKAARQLGAADSHSLPSNDEIEAELKAYQALYIPDEHRGVIETLRRQALEVLLALQRFDPVLVGPVLNGTASRHSDIEIELYTDSSKEFEQYLLNHGIDYKIQDRGAQLAYTLYADPANVWVHILPLDSRHAVARPKDDRPRRATAKQLAQLLQGDPQVGG
jgi:hypothetical protein